MERKSTKVKQNDRGSKKEYRVINLERRCYDTIRKYCDDNSLKMSRWIENEIVNIIKNK